MMFYQLNKITEKPTLYAIYTAEALWNDPYISGQMLKYHLDPSSDLASRNLEFIEALRWTTLSRHFFALV